jgi:pimeloyl-ACP methyl ester carboxylesterase
MRSSYTGFGYSSLANDAEDISALVQYLRVSGKKKVVLLGSSTGMYATTRAIKIGL